MIRAGILTEDDPVELSGPADRPEYRQQHTFSATEEVPLVVEGREVGRLPVSAMLP
jgi:hypothetical protein